MQGSLDFWTALVVASPNTQTEILFAAIDRLPLEDKAALVKHLLVSSGMNVVFGDSPLSNQSRLPIQSMDRAELGEVLQAIGDRLKRERAIDKEQPE